MTGRSWEDIQHKIEQLNLADGVIMLGQRTDVPYLLAAMDAFCLPSLYEGMPVVGIECQAAGVPALASTGITKELRMSSLVEFESLEEPPWHLGKTYPRPILFPREVFFQYGQI